MDSLALSAEGRKVLLAELQSVYDSHRYLDAYKLSAEYWDESTNIKELSAEEMIFTARLASRLGGFRLSRYFYRAAREREPNLPVVRYFTRNFERRPRLLLDELCEFEKNPELGGEDDRLRASWLAGYAYTFATLRDFSRATELMAQAHALSPVDAWLHSLEADVLGMADRWQESRCSAERGCETDPHSPWPVLSLATALLNLGEIRDAVHLLSHAAEGSQFFQLVQTACWYHCALAETFEGEEREKTLEAARRLAKRIEPMAPLGDREFKVGLARTWLDISELADDHAGMEHWSRKARSPFHRRIVSNLKANPNGKRVRLPYRRAIQKHVECVPTSIVSALSATGVNLSVEELAREVTFGGTAEWAAADWLRAKKFHVRFFSATSEIVVRLIEAGIGFTVSWEDDESGHTVAIVGIDHAAGTVIAHDPSSFRSTEYLLANFKNKYGPLGVVGMAVVPQRLAKAVDEILPPEAELVESARAQQKALRLHGPSAARPIVDAAGARFPEHPELQYLRAIQYLEDGRSGKALRSFQQLLTMYPKSPAVRTRLMSACRTLGDTTLLRETLRSVVDAGKVPGVHSQSEWSRPHYRYYYEYAELLRFSSETRRQAEALLGTGLRSYWRSAGAWHVLADLRWAERNIDSALVAYRFAATIAEDNEHYAHAYADALCRCGRQEQGMDWLRSRAKKLGNSLHGVSTWITYVDMLEDWGDPIKAIEVCRTTLSRFGDSASLLSFAVPFLARMGEWEEAEKQLQKLEATQARGYFHEASVYFNEMRGCTAKAQEHAEQWVSEFPLSLQARNKLLTLVAKVHGQASASQRATAWMRERPENENFEEMFCRNADSHRWRKLRVLTARVKRNREDAWAWRELAFTVIPMFEEADEERRRRLKPRICDYLAEADRVSAEEAATICTHGYWCEAQGKWSEAHACYLESIRRDPGNSYGYQRAFEISSRLSDDERRAMWAEMEPVWLESPGHLPNCLELMRLLNDAFGPRETERIIECWQRFRPNDPNVQEAMADLLLDHGHGRTDALRALELLRLAVERYPYHSGLRFSLANAYRATGDDASASQVFHELVRRRPDNVLALIQLAWIHEREGDVEHALQTLQRAQEQEPRNPNPVDARAQILIENQRFDEARSVIEEGLRKMQSSVSMYERAISLFSQCGDDERAVDAARAGIQAYPDGSYMWLLLGRTLREHPEFAAAGELEACLRRSLQLNSSLFESADWLTIMLTEQRRYEEAMQVISTVEMRTADPSSVHGRKAWIRRESGAKKEAVTDLSDVLKRFPGYSWGWNLLLAWLEEDRDWKLAANVLGLVPPQMLSDISFRLKRLLLLEKAKEKSSILNAEWTQLLTDFPENVPLYLNRFDSLAESGRWDEAAATLDQIMLAAGEDVYFMARLVDVKCRRGEFDEALEYAMRVCYAPVEHSPWPVNHVWEVLGRVIFGKVNNQPKLAEQFRTRLEEGIRPTPRALARYVEWIVDQERPGGFFRPLRQTRFHFVTREVISLMKIIERSSWRIEFSLSDVFDILSKHSYPRLVVRFWNERCNQGVDGDSAEWARAGSAMVTLNKKGSARELFRDWRRRRGVRMWSLANYLQCLSRLHGQDLQEVITTCNDALANLPHDHCARYLTFLQAEACALIGDKSGLLTLWNIRSAYFGGELKQGEYFRGEYKYLLYDLPDLVEVLQQGDQRAYQKILRRLRFQRLWNQERRATARRLLGWFLRLLVLFWLFGGLIRTFLP